MAAVGARLRGSLSGRAVRFGGLGLVKQSAFDKRKYASLHGYADDLEEVVQEFGRGTAVLVSHSVPPDLLPRLFQPLVRGVESAGEASSVGLGFYIVDAIVKAHDGVMLVSSSTEFGTSFVAKFRR